MFELKDFGKDHWSTFAYAEICAVDNHGRMDIRRLRVNETKRPIRSNGLGWNPEYGTRDKQGNIPDTAHDDIDCLDDLEHIGLLVTGTLVNPTAVLTELGKKVAHELRVHKMNGGQFREFESEILKQGVGIAPLPLSVLVEPEGFGEHDFFAEADNEQANKEVEEETRDNGY